MSIVIGIIYSDQYIHWLAHFFILGRPIYICICISLWPTHRWVIGLMIFNPFTIITLPMLITIANKLFKTFEEHIFIYIGIWFGGF